MQNGNFPKSFKISDLMPVYRKQGTYVKNNYRPISMISNLSNEINAYFDHILSNFQCGFRKCCSAQHCLLYMIEKIRKIRDSEGVFVAVLTDLSKALDCILYEVNIIDYYICLVESTETVN